MSAEIKGDERIRQSLNHLKHQKIFSRLSGKDSWSRDDPSEILKLNSWIERNPEKIKVEMWKLEHPNREKF